MASNVAILVYFFNFYLLVNSGYPPTGDEVQAGSVLLPASRRGRYLANIVRRQAVDGTGIKFNKDADRMNAEAKKKVDVLSEELLPYIIAEQERRTTLYKRIMTAIQNGEKGVTIAEIRNKPPLIIRKGLMYRCPSNRAPKEPDGSGLIMCEEEIEPTPVMYDSCLSAEDKELYVAENKYFFCNRHKVEGPDLPRNGSTVIGCAPIERTSLNYTTSKCALEDTDDVVVHYRYYPDRTYKFVTELDPDHEVCDHWNPCQIGYIFSLPSPDQAMLANELWRDYTEKFDEYERDEIVMPIPEDAIEEYVSPSTKIYTSSARKLAIPDGYEYDAVWVARPGDSRHTKVHPRHVTVNTAGSNVILSLTFDPWQGSKVGTYYAHFKKAGSKDKGKNEKFLILSSGTAAITAKTLELLPGQIVNTTTIDYKCTKCTLRSVMVRSADGSVHNLDGSKYRIKEKSDRTGKIQQFIEIDLAGTKPQDFGDYFAIIQNSEGAEERVKILSVKDKRNVLRAPRLKTASKVGDHYDKTIKYTCDDCELSDILCNGESVLQTGRVSVIPGSQMISFNFPSFEDSNCCVYMGVFKRDNQTYKKIIAVIENSAPTVTVTQPATINSPKDGEQLEQEIQYKCTDECSVAQVLVNGIPLETNTRRSASGPFAFYEATSTSIIVRVGEFTSAYEGVYQARFSTGDGRVTKTIMEIKNPESQEEEQADGGGGDGSDKPEGEGEATTAAAEGGTTAAAGDAQTAAGDAAALTEAAPPAPPA